MNKINGIETNEFIFEAVLKIIEGVVKLANSHGGKLYGSYVEDVIVPRLHNPSAICNHRTIHFLFKNQTDYNDFIRKLSITYSGLKAEHAAFYDRYVLMIDQLYVTAMVCFVNEAHDLDINTLYYGFENDVPTPLDHILVDKIINKQATVLPSFIEPFQNYPVEKQQMIIDSWNRHIRDGWVIHYNEVRMTTPIILEWFKDQLKPSLLQQFKNKQIEFELCLLERDKLLNACLEKVDQHVLYQYYQDHPSTKTLKDMSIEYLINL